MPFFYTNEHISMYKIGILQEKSDEMGRFLQRKFHYFIFLLYLCTQNE